MMKLCSKLLLLTSDTSIEGSFVTAASKLGMSSNILVAKRMPHGVVNYDVIVVDFTEAKKESTPSSAIVLLKDRKIGKLTDKYSRFIFNAEDPREIFLSFFVPDTGSVTEKVITYGCVTLDFTEDKYFLDGKEIYIRKKEKEYLRRRFLLRENVSDMRHLLFNMRQRFGRDFLTLDSGLC